MHYEIPFRPANIHRTRTRTPTPSSPASPDFPLLALLIVTSPGQLRVGTSINGHNLIVPEP